MSNKLSSYPASSQPAPLHRFGGIIGSTSELSFSASGDTYFIEGSGNVLSLPSWPKGAPIFVHILNSPTFVNSTRLLMPAGADYTFASGDSAQLLPLGNGVWRVVEIYRAIGKVATREVGGRLTLLPGTAETSSDITSVSTIYLTPFKSTTLPRYSGSGWAVDSLFGDISLALDGTSAHTNYHAAGQAFDAFYFMSAGVQRLGTGPSWASFTSRGAGAGTTEIEQYQGVWVNKNSIVLRYGSNSGDIITIPARQATLIGSFVIPSSGSAGLVSDTLGLRLVSNVNDVQRRLYTKDPAGTWTYSTAAFREINNNSANRLQVFCCLPKKAWARYMPDVNTSNASIFQYCTTNIGIDSTTIGTALQAKACATRNDFHASCEAYWEGELSVGYHYFAALERGAGADTQTWYSGSIVSSESAPFIGGILG